MKKAYLVAFCAVAFGALPACTVADEGTSLEIVDAVPPNDQCAFAADSTVSQSAGYYDPAGAGIGFPNSYTLALRVRNHLNSKGADAASSFNNENVRKDGNNVSISGFDVCYYTPDEFGVSEFGSHGEGLAVSCDQVDASRREFIVGSGQLPTSDEDPIPLAIASAQVLGPAAMRALFGADFNPAGLSSSMQVARFASQPGIIDQPYAGELAARGAVAPAFPLGTVSIWGVPSPSSVCRPAAAGEQCPSVHHCGTGFCQDRNPAWDEYPTARQQDVIVQVRVVGRTQSDMAVQSNWFTFPVTICVGCIAAQCAPLFSVECPDTVCAGLPCSNDDNLCRAADGNLDPGNIACVPAVGQTGQAPDFQDANCMPFQAGSTVQCLDVASCGAGDGG